MKAISIPHPLEVTVYGQCFRPIAEFSSLEGVNEIGNLKHLSVMEGIEPLTPILTVLHTIH